MHGIWVKTWGNSNYVTTKKIERQSTNDTEVAPVVQIVTEEEYIELFGAESDDKTFNGDCIEIGLENTEETSETQSVEDDSIEEAE